jgi:hypothetical protein
MICDKWAHRAKGSDIQGKFANFNERPRFKKNVHLGRSLAVTAVRCRPGLTGEAKGLRRSWPPSDEEVPVQKTRPRNREVHFIVKFDDDRSESITITEGMLLTGEKPFSIALRRQANGGLSPGWIVSIARDGSGYK